MYGYAYCSESFPEGAEIQLADQCGLAVLRGLKKMGKLSFCFCETQSGFKTICAATAAEWRSL